MAASTDPSCTKCAHYFITHDAQFLNGCRILNFKSKRLPQNEVREASGESCLAYSAKKSSPPRE